MNWYEVDNAVNIDTPALLIYKEQLQQNIDTAIRIARDPVNLRPHIKTNKSKEVCKMLMMKGIEKFKCATIAEAELLGEIRAKDVLLAYQPVGPKVNRLLNLVKHFTATRYSCLIDNAAVARELSNAFGEQGLKSLVWVDLNTGMDRTGVLPEDSIGLLDELLEMAGLEVMGFHIYDGHIVDSDFGKRQKNSDEGFARTETIRAYFKERTGVAASVVAGGSPTFRTHIKRNIECSPGTFVFWDMGYRHLFPDEPFVFSALVMTRVISIVNSTTVTTDLGYKSVASENPLPRVYFLNAPDTKVVFQNEEHLVLEVTDSKLYKPGDILYGVPEHICPTVALYDEAFMIENNLFTDRWDVVGRKKMIRY
jgi:D-threonine aldolase